MGLGLRVLLPRPFIRRARVKRFLNGNDVPIHNLRSLFQNEPIKIEYFRNGPIKIGQKEATNPDRVFQKWTNQNRTKEMARCRPLLNLHISRIESKDTHPLIEMHHPEREFWTSASNVINTLLHDRERLKLDGVVVGVRTHEAADVDEILFSTLVEQYGLDDMSLYFHIVEQLVYVKDQGMNVMWHHGNKIDLLQTLKHPVELSVHRCKPTTVIGVPLENIQNLRSHVQSWLDNDPETSEVSCCPLTCLSILECRLTSTKASQLLGHILPHCDPLEFNAETTRPSFDHRLAWNRDDGTLALRPTPALRQALEKFHSQLQSRLLANGFDPQDLNRKTSWNLTLATNVKTFPMPLQQAKIHVMAELESQTLAQYVGGNAQMTLILRCALPSASSHPRQPPPIWSRVLKQTIKQQKKKKTVMIMRGLPGSGKSTLANHVCTLARRENLQAQICSADAFFIDSKTGAYRFNRSRIRQAHAACQATFHEALNHPNISLIVVDNTHSQMWEYQVYVDESTRRNDVDLVIVEILCPDALTAARFALRNAHQVGLDVVWNMLGRWEHNPNSHMVPPSFQEVPHSLFFQHPHPPLSLKAHHVAIYLTPESQSRLLSRIRPTFPMSVHATHVTLLYRATPRLSQVLPTSLWGTKCQVRVTSVVENDAVQAVSVKLLSPLTVVCVNAVLHITISVAPGAKAHMANALCHDPRTRKTLVSNRLVLDGQLGIQYSKSPQGTIRHWPVIRNDPWKQKQWYVVYIFCTPATTMNEDAVVYHEWLEEHVDGFHGRMNTLSIVLSQHPCHLLNTTRMAERGEVILATNLDESPLETLLTQTERVQVFCDSSRADVVALGHRGRQVHYFHPTLYVPSRCVWTEVESHVRKTCQHEITRLWTTHIDPEAKIQILEQHTTTHVLILSSSRENVKVLETQLQTFAKTLSDLAMYYVFHDNNSHLLVGLELSREWKGTPFQIHLVFPAQRQNVEQILARSTCDLQKLDMNCGHSERHQDDIDFDLDSFLALGQLWLAFDQSEVTCGFTEWLMTRQPLQRRRQSLPKEDRVELCLQSQNYRPTLEMEEVWKSHMELKYVFMKEVRSILRNQCHDIYVEVLMQKNQTLSIHVSKSSATIVHQCLVDHIAQINAKRSGFLSSWVVLDC